MNPNDRSEVDDIFATGDLTTLVDLQKFLADELIQGADKGVDLSRAFTPLSDGLGIQCGPVRTQASPAGATKAGTPTFSPPLPPMEAKEPEIARQPKRLIIDDSVESDTTADSFRDDFALATPPPPVPAPGIFRRVFSGLVDQSFVLLAWGLLLAITSNALSGGSGDLVSRFSHLMGNPAFVRSAMLEFGVIWLGYLAFSIGVLEMTFGMWVWGLRFSFGQEGRVWKKIARVVLSLFFYPLIAPTLLLVFRKDGHHLIDALTQSYSYRVG